MRIYNTSEYASYVLENTRISDLSSREKMAISQILDVCGLGEHEKSLVSDTDGVYRSDRVTLIEEKTGWHDRCQTVVIDGVIVTKNKRFLETYDYETKHILINTVYWRYAAGRFEMMWAAQRSGTMAICHLPEANTYVFARKTPS